MGWKEDIRFREEYNDGIRQEELEMGWKEDIRFREEYNDGIRQEELEEGLKGRYIMVVLYKKRVEGW